MVSLYVESLYFNETELVNQTQRFDIWVGLHEKSFSIISDDQLDIMDCNLPTYLAVSNIPSFCYCEAIVV